MQSSDPNSDDLFRRSKLPLKDSNVAIKGKASQGSTSESLTLLINDLEGKVNLKSIFAEITMNQEGQY